MKIILKGQTPSKKNSKIMVFSKKKIIACIKGYQERLGKYKPGESLYFPTVLSDILATVEKSKPIIISNKNYYDWHKKNLILLKGKHKRVSYKPALVCINLYRKTKHRIDWNNISQAITDMLVNLDILEDDNTEFCKPVFGSVFYDKENPRAEITITNWSYPFVWNTTLEK